jgi:hypothetical protein
VTSTKTAAKPKRAPAHRPLPPEERVATALFRLHKERAIRTVIRGTLPLPLLRRLLRDTIPKREAAAMPDEVWSAMAANVAAESADYGLILGQALHDRLAWDQEPATPEEWAHLGQERPLEALWMAALSESKAVRKGFPQFAAGCLKTFHASPASRPPSWEFVEEVLTVHGSALQDLRDAERDLDDAERRHEAERQRSDDLRDELKRLRRETSELRTEKALSEKKAAAALEARARETPADAQRFLELERRLRKADKENEHLRRELERARTETDETDEGGEVEPLDEADATPATPEHAPQPPLSEDPNERRRVMRQMLRKLFKKGKIGASHTHEDNVFRGVPDHAKGTAKAIIDLLYREGVLMPKPTTTDPHVSLSPERTAEVRAIIAGTIENPRLRRFVEESE